MGYPSKEDEKMVLSTYQQNHPLESLENVITKEELLAAQVYAKTVLVSECIKSYIVDLAYATRCHNKIKLGISLRGSLALLKASQAYALIKGREYVLPDDVKTMVKNVCAHRILGKGHYISTSNENIEGILDKILASVPVPIE